MDHLILETKNLCKTFDKQEVVKNVSLQISKNCIYGLLGANGAGKSTTLKLLTGMIRPTTGKIIMEGHKWTRKDLQNIGALIEEAPLYPNLSAEENLKVRTMALGIKEERIKEVLKIVDLENTGNKKAGKFSMGMKQRLGIAIALINNPSLLILDEPTNGLDPFGIQELRELICSFPSKGITVIVSSHILSEVSQMADYIGIMAGGILGYQGKYNQEDNLEELFMNVAGKYRREGE